MLCELHGHLRSITDIKYSNIGDRLLTASQKEGTVRLWSWGSEQFDDTRQILIRLTLPPSFRETSNNSSGRSGPCRRRARNKSASKVTVQCDVATWTSDDLKIVTSQSCITNGRTTEVLSGSHVIYVWDSVTGQCLIGLPSIHNSGCPVVISHPFDSSILATAGGDGCLKVLNLETGDCLFSHENIHQYGAMESESDLGKVCGYLDGNFSPDGTALVLTDDQGRVTIIDTFREEQDGKLNEANDSDCEILDSTPSNNVVPLWMFEQYFANDYYELFYDSTGYCVERGSQQPPHIAPGAARCNHLGVPYFEPIQEAFALLSGPAPLEENDVRLKRETLREDSFRVREVGGILAQNVARKRPLIEACASGLEVKESKSIPFSAKIDGNTRESQIRRAQASTNSVTRTLSSNYRWLDNEDVMREENAAAQFEAADDEDEDYHDLAVNVLEEDIEFEDSDTDGSLRGTRTFRRSGGQMRQNRGRQHPMNREANEIQPSRMSSRQAARMDFADDDESEHEEQVLSHNTKPFPEIAHDFKNLGFPFKLPNPNSIRREWVTRKECTSGATGLKVFLPQVGDTVVYIPRAHYDTLKAFPNTSDSSALPWNLFPNASPWPVVQCEVNDVRYRFPQDP